jgi:two-component system sensor histidine kinase QseC
VTTTTRWFSLRRRLLLILLAGVAVGWLLAVAYSYRDAHREIDKLFDGQMIQMAETLLVLAGDRDDEHELARLESGGHTDATEYVFQVIDDTGRILLRSPHAPHDILTPQDGFSMQGAMSDAGWRYFGRTDRDNGLRVVVAENHHTRDELSERIVWRMVVPALLAFPLLGAWIWYATYLGLKPLGEVAAEVSAREPERLAPIIPARAALEVRALLDAINSLMQRVADTLSRERRFTADAAHELRTPLAALVTQADVARRARDEAERLHALTQITTGAHRAGRLVEQLLTLARLDPAAVLKTESVPLEQVAAEVCADHAATAQEKQIALELEADPALSIDGVPDMLRVLLRNLVDNALRYTPPRGRVLISIARHDGRTTLSVSDNGPGIPVADRAMALQRFHRLAGQETQGSGLGLSIVARIAELHQAELSLVEGLEGKGLAVRVRF